MFKNLFRPDSPLMVFMTQVTDCIFLSLFFIVGCLPVLTIGPAFAALYDSVYRGFRDGERNTWQRFWHSFLHNLKSGFVPTLLFLAAVSGLVCAAVGCWNQAVYGNISWMAFAGLELLVMVGVGVVSLLFPMLSRFENSLGALLKNTLVLSLANMPRTLALGILNALAAFLCVRLIVPLFFLPALAALIGSLLIEPIFRPFMPEPPEENEETEENEEAAT